jgi:hypothetical protein
MKSKGKSISLFLMLLLAISVGAIIIKPTSASVPITNTGSPITLSCIGYTESTITFSWTQSDNPNFASYTLFESGFDAFTIDNPNNYYFDAWSTSNKGTTQATIQVSNINIIHKGLSSKDAITYFFYIAENSTSGNSIKSNIIKASPTSPPNPNLYVSAKTENSVTLAWADYNNYCPQTPFISYTVQISNSSKDGPWTTVKEITDSLTRSCTITGLKKETYYIQVYDTVGTTTNSKSYSNSVLFSNSQEINKTQTPTPTESYSPSSSPSVPEFPIIAIIPLMIALFLSTIMIKYKTWKKLY